MTIPDRMLSDKELRELLRRLTEEQRAMDHAIRTGEVKLKRTPINSTPAQHLDEDQ